MNDYKALTCKKCGGALNPDTMRCPYCGTYHRWESSSYKPTLIEVARTGVRVYQSKLTIDRYARQILSPEMLAEQIKGTMAQKLIREGIAENIELYQDFDIEHYEEKWIGRVRVLEPTYRF